MSPTATLQATTTSACTPPATTARAATSFDAPHGRVADADTNEGLSLALALIERDGWESAAGRAVVAALQGRCARWAARRVLALPVGSGGLAPGEVLSVAWCTLARFSARVAASEAPWAYLWTSVHHEMAVEVAAAQTLSRLAIHGGRAGWPARAVRGGIDARDVHWPDYVNHGPLGEAYVRAEDDVLSPSLAALIGHLADGDEAEAVFWTDALTRALDVLDGARPSYQHAALRADPYLRQVLGLTPQELGALGALLVGPRRGDRAGQCLLLALVRDPGTDPASVPGAVARLRLLTARRPAPAATAATVVGAAA